MSELTTEFLVTINGIGYVAAERILTEYKSLSELKSAIESGSQVVNTRTTNALRSYFSQQVDGSGEDSGGVVEASTEEVTEGSSEDQVQ